jgi:hypothetical protein
VSKIAIQKKSSWLTSPNWLCTVLGLSSSTDSEVCGWLGFFGHLWAILFGTGFNPHPIFDTSDFLGWNRWRTIEFIVFLPFWYIHFGMGSKQVFWCRLASESRFLPLDGDSLWDSWVDIESNSPFWGFFKSASCRTLLWRNYFILVANLVDCRFIVVSEPTHIVVCLFGLDTHQFRFFRMTLGKALGSNRNYDVHGSVYSPKAFSRVFRNSCRHTSDVCPCFLFRMGHLHSFVQNDVSSRLFFRL